MMLSSKMGLCSKLWICELDDSLFEYVMLYFNLCWMNTRMNPALSGSGFAIISKINQHPTSKRKNRIGK